MNQPLDHQQKATAVAAIVAANTAYVGLRAATGVKGNAPAAEISKLGDPRTHLAWALSIAMAHWPGNRRWQIVGGELIDQASDGQFPPGFIVIRQPVTLGEFTSRQEAAA